MAKKNKKSIPVQMPKTNKVLEPIKIQATQHVFTNGFICGHGEHGSSKYPNRAKRARDNRKMIMEYCR
jgi:hypothetical protein